MSAPKTLSFVLQNGEFGLEEGQRVLFLNADPLFDYAVFSGSDLSVYQIFKPAFAALKAKGLTPISELPQKSAEFDMVCLNVPKNMVEARYLSAYGLSLLSQNGVFICAADNKAGGTRLKKMLEKYGLSEIGQENRNKARCCWGRASQLNDEAVSGAIKDGKEQDVLSGQFVSQAGVFGWDKVDKGSEILTRYIPKDLKGRGADFGCGYGYIAKFILDNCPKVKRLSCIDADYRAVQLCKENLSAIDIPKDFIWADLNTPLKELKSLNFIAMNPPFHEGKKESVELGKNFIDTAYHALGRNGRLYIVANAHLPYERLLEERFFSCEKIHEGQGFKVFEAVK